jgi:hypothetical protein
MSRTLPIRCLPNVQKRSGIAVDLGSKTLYEGKASIQLIFKRQNRVTDRPFISEIAAFLTPQDISALTGVNGPAAGTSVFNELLTAASELYVLHTARGFLLLLVFDTERVAPRTVWLKHEDAIRYFKLLPKMTRRKPKANEPAQPEFDPASFEP